MSAKLYFELWARRNETAVKAVMYYLVRAMFSTLFISRASRQARLIYLFIQEHTFQIICHMLNERNNLKHVSELSEGRVFLQYCM